MVPTFPPEIWLRTAQFIPLRILRNLYSVNPIFLDLALNDRYNDINLAVYWTATTTKLLKHLNHPHIAHRVRRLTLSSNWLKSHMHLDPSEEVTFVTKVAWYLPFDLGRFIRVDPIACRESNVKMCNELMETTVANFPNVSSLIIVGGPGPYSQTQLNPLLMNAYTACASNLRTLSLIETSDNFNALLPSHPSVLTSLEEVTLSFSSRADYSTEAALIFFRAIASTLTSLNISFRCAFYETPRLLQSLLRQGEGKTAFPKLTSFSLSYFKPPASPDSILMQFLNQHADTLKHLRLQHTKTTPFASQSLDHLDPLLLPVLPHLETLDILNGSSSGKHQELASSEGLGAARAYVQHSWSTLTSLELTHCSFTRRDLGMLLDLVGRGSPKNAEGGGLKSLTVTVQVLSPQMLDMMAEKLPQLERLKVDFANLRSHDGADVPTLTRADLGDLTHEDIEQFLLQMRTRSYSMWSLRSFGINRVCMRSDKAMEILMPLTLCIPHLMEIDGPFVKMWREPWSTWKASDCDDPIFNDKPRDEWIWKGCLRSQRVLLEDIVRPLATEESPGYVDNYSGTYAIRRKCVQ